MTEACAYCGAPAHTKDHVPTRKLFPVPRPSDLITVPCCGDCNNALSVEEEYFVHVLLSFREADTLVARALREQFFSKDRTPRRVRMAHRMLDSTGEAPVIGSDGVPVAHAPTFTVDRPPFDRVADRITRGVYFHVFRARVPAERVSEVLMGPEAELLEGQAVE